MTTVNSKSHQVNAVVTGIFFIAATVAAIIGMILYDPILNHADALITGARHSNQIVLGALFELILACSAVGTAIMLFPYLRRFNESWGLGYVCFRLLEVIFILLGLVSMLLFLALSHEYSSQSEPNVAAFQITAKLLKTMHGWAFILGPHFMLGINTFIYSSILYRNKLVPRKLAIVGIAGAVLIFTAALLEMFSIISPFSVTTLIFALPIAIYEMVLAGWLIIKGFNLAAGSS